MNKYHHYEKKKVQWSMIGFVIFESLDLFIVLLKEIAFDNEFLKFCIDVELSLGGYIFFQALGIILIKKTRDPLERISKIGYLQLVSSNQKLNKEFMSNMFEQTEWKNLT